MKVLAKEVHANIKNARLIDQRRRQIVDGAMQVFAAKGFHGATVREIADAAGLTMGTMYNYVRSKEDILYIVYDFMTTILSEGLTKTIDDTVDPQGEDQRRPEAQYGADLSIPGRDHVPLPRGRQLRP